MLLTLVLISFNGSLAVQVTASPNEVRDILGSALIHFRRTLPAGPTALDPTPPPAPLMLEDNDSLSPRGRAWDGPRASINGDLA
ncbi:MAG TPA: hypothetical protein VD793_05285, partial [Gemmatimonadales bacterium]|nr:hypothetical protein [Gemmatimonadales bacterium]